jgi:hypothetical protein
MNCCACRPDYVGTLQPKICLSREVIQVLLQYFAGLRCRCTLGKRRRHPLLRHSLLRHPLLLCMPRCGMMHSKRETRPLLTTATTRMKHRRERGAAFPAHVCMTCDGLPLEAVDAGDPCRATSLRHSAAVRRGHLNSLCSDVGLIYRVVCSTSMRRLIAGHCAGRPRLRRRIRV